MESKREQSSLKKEKGKFSTKILYVYISLIKKKEKKFELLWFCIGENSNFLERV